VVDDAQKLTETCAEGMTACGHGFRGSHHGPASDAEVEDQERHDATRCTYTLNALITDSADVLNEIGVLTVAKTALTSRDSSTRAAKG
jgi:hypothetical protein